MSGYDVFERMLAGEASLTAQPSSHWTNAALMAAATALPADADARQEALVVAEEFLAIENEALEGNFCGC